MAQAPQRLLIPQHKPKWAQGRTAPLDVSAPEVLWHAFQLDRSHGHKQER